MPTRQQVMEAAAEVEKLAALMKQAVLDLRADSNTDRGREFAYARVYDIRWRLGRIANRLGYGVPQHLGIIREETDRWLKEG